MRILNRDDSFSSLQFSSVANEMNETWSPHTHTSYVHVLYYIIEIILALFAIIGNSLILIAYYCNRRLRIIPHYHLVSLAISDFLMGVVTIPMWLAAAYQGYPHNQYVCLFSLSTVLFVDLATVFALLTMATDRYVFICWPLQYNTLVTSKRAIGVIVLAWTLSAVFVSPMGFTWHWTASQNQHCHFVVLVDANYLVYIFVICIILPILVMSFMYVHILVIIRQHKKKEKAVYTTFLRLQSMSASQKRINSSVCSETNLTPDVRAALSRRRFKLNSESQIAIFFAFLMFFFVVTWVPIFALDIMRYLGSPVSQNSINFAVLLSHCNSSFNPFLYRFRNDFNETFILWTCKRRRPSYNSRDDSISVVSRRNISVSPTPV